MTIMFIFLFMYHFKCQILDMVKVNLDIKQQDFKIVDLILSNLNNFYSVEIVNTVSETIKKLGG